MIYQIKGSTTNNIIYKHEFNNIFSYRSNENFKFKSNKVIGGSKIGFSIIRFLFFF